MDREIINNMLGITESYKMPDKLLSVLLNNPTEIFEKFKAIEQDLSYDWFTDYFQQEQGDRNALKQDFTPVGIAKLLSKITPNAEVIADYCAGTGGLTISAWLNNQDSVFVCYELSSRAIPMLLFNLAIRNMCGYVVHGDVLTEQIQQAYKIERGDIFSNIVKLQNTNEIPKPNLIISNPPYSLPWSNVSEFANDKRFKDYTLPPKNKADYGFVLTAMNNIETHGKAFFILPHGVLFRGASEGKIRQKLIDNNLIDTIIGLPDKMFLNTDIPICILVLNTNKADANIFFIDSSKECYHKGKNNYFSDKDIDTISSVCKLRKDVDKLSHVATLQEIQENDYNLNIPRYVDTYEPEQLPDVATQFKELIGIEEQIKKANAEIINMFNELYCTNADVEKEWSEIKQGLSKLSEVKYGRK